MSGARGTAMTMAARVISIEAIVAILLAACTSTVAPSGGQATNASARTSPRPSAVATAARSDVPASETTTQLVGEWRRVNSCEAYVVALEAAGFGANRDRWLVDFGGYWASQEDIPAGDPCVNATEVEHSHFFTGDGQFGSRDEHGAQVDEGDYNVDGPKLAFPSHEREFGYGPIDVEYEIGADGALELIVNVPDECSDACEVAHVWALSAFYPGPFTRD